MMRIRKIPFWTLAVLLLVACSSVFAQGPTPDTPSVSVEPVSTPIMTQPTFERHKFLDRQNKLLFIAAAAFDSADFAVTRSNLQNGGQELNPLVRPFGRSTAGLAINFAGETASVITLSYFLHKTGHHKMERYISYIDIGASAGAVSYGLAHR